MLLSLRPCLSWIRSRFYRSSSLIATGAIAVGLVSCGESKVAQCNRLAEMVNQTESFMGEFETEIQSFSQDITNVESLDDIKAATGEYTAAVEKVVTNWDTLASELETTELEDEILVQFRDDYITIIRGYSSALTEASTAIGSIVNVQSEEELPDQIEQSQTQVTTAVGKIQQLSQQESQSIQEVNEYCGAVLPTEGTEGVEGATEEPPAEEPQTETPAAEPETAPPAE
ncbi:MAG: hypothetical protein ACTS2F_05020 [Thainema sp.]